MNRYCPPSSERFLIVFDCLEVLEIWHQCDCASGEYGTFSLVEIQRLDSLDIVHNMRRSELSTIARDEHLSQGRRFSSSYSSQPIALRGDMVILGQVAAVVRNG